MDAYYRYLHVVNLVGFYGPGSEKGFSLVSLHSFGVTTKKINCYAMKIIAMQWFIVSTQPPPPTLFIKIKIVFGCKYNSTSTANGVTILLCCS